MWSNLPYDATVAIVNMPAKRDRQLSCMRWDFITGNALVKPINTDYVTFRTIRNDQNICAIYFHLKKPLLKNSFNAQILCENNRHANDNNTIKIIKLFLKYHLSIWTETSFILESTNNSNDLMFIKIRYIWKCVWWMLKKYHENRILEFAFLFVYFIYQNFGRDMRNFDYIDVESVYI